MTSKRTWKKFMGLLVMAGSMAISYYFASKVGRYFASTDVVDPVDTEARKQEAGILNMQKLSKTLTATPGIQSVVGKQRLALVENNINPFVSRKWGPAVIAVQPSSIVPMGAPLLEAPAAPSLPMAFVGRLEDFEDSPPKVFLSLRGMLLIVGVGDLIEGMYRVDEITPQSATFTYLPLNQQQKLGFPG